jgi:hypothetical protein
MMRLRGKLVTSQLLREEEEETDYVAIPLRRDSITSRFLRTYGLGDPLVDHDLSALYNITTKI